MSTDCLFITYTRKGHEDSYNSEDNNTVDSNNVIIFDDDDGGDYGRKKPVASLLKENAVIVSSAAAITTNRLCSNQELVTLSKPKKKKNKEFPIDAEEKPKPAHTRKTKNGGYSHTNQSKSRISKANSGKKPWNVGKQRSSADKAKIAAGVRARNRSLLLAKLELWGMAEEEYLQKKKEIKYLRERLRRAKKAGKEFEGLRKRLKAMMGLFSDNKVPTSNTTNVTDDKSISNCINGGINQKKSRTAEKFPYIVVEDKSVAKPQGETKKVQIKLRSEEVFFRPFLHYDSTGKKTNFNNCKISCKKQPPRKLGGNDVGTLTCCDGCASKFNDYLMMTLEDAEAIRINSVAGDVTQLVELLGNTKNILRGATDIAKTKAPPLPPVYSAGRNDSSIKKGKASRPKARPAPMRNVKEDNAVNHDVNFGDYWNATSAFDIGGIETENFASV